MSRPARSEMGDGWAVEWSKCLAISPPDSLAASCKLGVPWGMSFHRREVWGTVGLGRCATAATLAHGLVCPQPFNSVFIASMESAEQTDSVAWLRVAVTTPQSSTFD